MSQNWANNVRAKQEQEKLYAPEKVLKYSPVRVQNFEKILNNVRENLSEHQLAVLDALYSGDKDSFRKAMEEFAKAEAGKNKSKSKNTKPSLDFLKADGVEGLTFLHVVAARVPKDDRETKQVGELISHLVNKLKIDPLAKANFSVDVAGKKEELSLTPLSFAAKIPSEDPERRTASTFSALFSEVQNEYKNKINQVSFGKGFTDLANELVCAGRDDLYQLACKGKPIHINPLYIGGSLPSFLRDNIPYFEAESTPKEIRDSFDKFVDIYEKRLSTQPKVVNPAMIGMYDRYNEFSKNGVFPILLGNIPFLKVITPEILSEMRKTDPNIPDDVVSAMVFSKIDKNISKGDILPKIVLSGDECCKDPSFAKHVDAAKKFFDSESGELGRDNLYYQSGNVVFFRNNEKSRTCLVDDIFALAMHIKNTFKVPEEYFPQSLSEKSPQIRQLFDDRNLGIENLQSLGEMSTANRITELSKLNIDELKLIMDVAGPRMTDIVLDSLKPHVKTALERYVQSSGRGHLLPSANKQHIG